MKSLFTLALLLTLTTTITRAQSWHYGLKAGLTLSNIDGNGMSSKVKPGFQIGGFAERTFNSKWSIQPELMFSQSVVTRNDEFLKYYNTEGRSGTKDKVSLWYVAVPVLVRYNITPVISVLAGPQYGILVGTNEEFLRGDRNAFKRSEFSANIGAQVNLNAVSFYARYNKGLNNVNDIDDRYKWTSNQVQVGIAVKIK
ncbi:MAG: porin family protein [Chitinophagaceae bacterium]